MLRLFCRINFAANASILRKKNTLIDSDFLHAVS